MKVFLDSNVLILLAKNSDLRTTFIKTIEIKSTIVYINDIVKAEVLKNPKEVKERKIIESLIDKFILETSLHYVTIGKSVIGGNDLIAPNFDIWNTPLDTKEAYRKSGTSKTPEQWITNKLNDSRNYDHATLLGVDYYLTEEKRHQKMIFKNKPNIISLNKFLDLNIN